MSKFFVESNPYHDNGTIYEQLFDSFESAVAYGKENDGGCHGFNVYEIQETQLVMIDSFTIESYVDENDTSKYQYTDWMNRQQYLDWDIERSKRRSIEKYGWSKEEWNEWATECGYSQEHFIK